MAVPSPQPPHPPSALHTVTSTTLLEGLADPENRTVWQAYVGRYRPLIVGYARRLGLAEADAEDVAQTSLLAFSTAYREGKYERERGRLSSWLFGIVHRQVLNWRRRSAREQAHGEEQDTAMLAQLPAEDALRERWDAEWADAVLRQCLAEIRREVQPESYEAFVLFAVEGRPADEVASRLGTTANAVYLAKRRILQRLRELRPLVEDLF